MRYHLRDLFRDVIETAKDAGIWQELTLEEKNTLVEYFLCHFEMFMQEVQWHKVSSLMTSYVTAGSIRGGTEGGRER